jgi:hypothetical protein
MPARYFLSRNWSICRVEGKVISLNIRSGKFMELTAADSNSMRKYVVDWPHTVDHTCNGSNAQNYAGHTATIVRSLVEMGIIVSKKKRGRAPTLTSIPQANAALLDEYDYYGAQTRLRDWIRFACATLSVALRPHSAHAVNSYLARRLRNASDRIATADDSNQNLEDVRHATALFRSMRPILWKSKHQRSFEQWILFKFLGYQGIRSYWVVGICAHDSELHSWLQIAESVIDDVPARTARFTPVVAFQYDGVAL